MIYLNKPYPLPILRKMQIENYDLYQCPASIEFSEKLNVVFGSNGMGKSTLLYIIQYALIGPYIKGVETRSYKGEQRIKRPIFSNDFFRLRMTKQDVNATVTLRFTIANNEFITTHSLYDNTLMKVLLNGYEIKGESKQYSSYEKLYYSTDDEKRSIENTLIYRYHDALVNATGLPDIESFIILMTECMFFSEDRVYTFWSDELNNTIISKYFMGAADYKQFIAQQQEEKYFDSQLRLKIYEISFVRRFLDSQKRETKPNEYTVEMLNTIRDERDNVYSNISRIRKRILKYENEIISNKGRIEKLGNHIESLNQAWYETAFPNEYQEVFNRYSRSLLNGLCPFCGNKGDFHISSDQCFFCSQPIEASSNIDLNEIEKQKRILEKEQDVLVSNQSNIQDRLFTAKMKLTEHEKISLNLKQKENDVRMYLDKTSNSDYEKVKTLELERDKLRAELDKAESNMRKIIRELDEMIKGNFLDYRKNFRKYASSFFSEDHITDLSLIGDREEKLFSFTLDYKERNHFRSLSESQRIFVDLAFRLSILDYFHQTSFFICETPDSTLDINSEKRAVKTFSNYINAGNTLFLTANLRRSELVQMLIEVYRDNCNVINLFDLSSTSQETRQEFSDEVIQEFLLGGRIK